MHRPIIARLESRQHLAVNTLPDFGGLPRELTQVEDTLYFALDSKLDGHLTYVDLVAYNLETGAKTSIRRDDGKAFGRTQYFLSKVGDHLVIAEKFGPSYAPSYEVWTCARGETRASRAVPGRMTEVPKFVPAGGRVFFTAAPDQGANGLYVLGRTGSAKLAYPASAFGVMAGFAPFGNGIAVFGGATRSHPNRATTLYVGSGEPGTLKQIKTLPSGASNFNGFSAGNYLVLTASFKDRTSVYSSLDASKWTLIMPDQNARYANARALTADVSQAQIGWASEPGESITQTYTRVNLKTGRMFPVVDPHLSYERVGNFLYMRSGATVSPEDPEAVGGYVAPGGSGYYASNITYTYTSTLRRLDLSTDVEVALPNFTIPVEGLTQREEVYTSAGFVQAGDLTYFVRQAGTFGGKGRALWLCSTDGTAAGTLHYNAIAAGPFAWKGRIFMMESMSSTSLQPFTGSTGAIDGRVVIDTHSAKTFTDSMTPLRGRRVFIDSNNNGKFDKSSERSMFTDSTGHYRFDDVRAGKHTVRLATESGWQATRGWSKMVSVQHGHARAVWFGLKDVVRNGVINGYYGSSYANFTAFLDINRNGTLDAGERTSSFVLDAGRYRCRFTNVRAGDYQLRFYLPSEGTLVGLGDDLSVSAGQRVSVGTRI